MIQVYILLLLGLLLLFISGKFLVESSVLIAHRLRIPTMIIGLTVVAFGTSAPELLVSVQAAMKGFPEMAVGNVVGSNISNILLVLAITAMIYPIPVPASSVRKDWPILMFVSLLLFVFVQDGELSPWEAMVFIALLLAYLVIVVVSARRRKEVSVEGSGEAMGEGSGEVLPEGSGEALLEGAAEASEEAREVEELEEEGSGGGMPVWLGLLIFLVSCAGLALGASLLVDNAAIIAEQLGVSQRVISITMVAVGTSIPELATSVIAALKKETDISVGNIIGSNIMNILSVLGITGSFGGIQVEEALARFDIPWMLGVTLLLLLVMVPARRSWITRWEGILMILIYFLYVYLIF